MSTSPWLPVTAHGSPTGAKVSGTVTRLRQLEAAHHRAPCTAASLWPVGFGNGPGGCWPVFWHSRTASSATVLVGGWSSGGRLAAASQLTPMIGTATRAHGTVSEQPRDALMSAVNTSNLALPVPSRAV